MPNYPQRKPLRLKDHDYSADGYYFLTICTKEKRCILSSITVGAQLDAVVKLSPYGMAAETYIKSIPGIDSYVIMPNHVHMIIHKANGKSIASDVRSFKALTTRKLGVSIWQDYYYDHIIRDEADYLTKRRYIEENPAKWSEDEYRVT
ncbi:MAG: transposase [Oscillospiraceae bacterium]|nr:transposase [Oscillospiraceae bacterium]